MAKQKKTTDNKPTKKQLDFAKDLSKRLDIELPEEALQDKKKLSFWIEEAVKVGKSREEEIAKGMLEELHKRIDRLPKGDILFSLTLLDTKEKMEAGLEEPASLQDVIHSSNVVNGKDKKEILPLLAQYFAQGY